MSFLKKLFGGGSASQEPALETSHEGYTILAAPIAENGQYRVCALIRREIDGEILEHKLIRADMCSSRDDAVELSVRKAKQVINERGEKLFG